ncbi:hypothetical protein GQ42DRAFT_172908 [Ramicandelaber brevisporus]|nr:hypothetical protein GQ42DRAFT_172908 [Ramicandelaber brevisporus]
MPATTTSHVHSTATSATTTESVSIPVDNSQRSKSVNVDAYSIMPVDNDVCVSAEAKFTPTRYPLSSQESAILAELIGLVTTQLQSPEFEIHTLSGRYNGSYTSKTYPPLSTERVNGILGSHHLYRIVDGSFESRIHDTEYASRIPELVNGIVEQYIKAYFDSKPPKSDDGKDSSRDDISYVKINEMAGAFLRFARLNSFQVEVIQVLATLGYRLQCNIGIYDSRLLIGDRLYHGYVFALCTTDLVEKLDDITRQGSAHIILLHIFTFYSVLLQLFVKNRISRYILPVNYQECCRIDRYSAIMPGLVDFYKHSDSPQSETEPSVKNPHTIGHWTLMKSDKNKLAFISNLCEGCGVCNRAGHPISSRDPSYGNMLSLVPERGIFKLYTDWQLLVGYVILVGAIATAVSLIVIYRGDGVDPGGLIGTIVLVIIASVGFVRELFYPETELRDFLRAMVAISKFSEYCKQNGVCGSCVAALAVKHRADFGPVAVGPCASIAGGRPGPAERGKIFMDEPCGIKCFYKARFTFIRGIQVISDEFDKDIDGDTRIAKMEWPSVFEQLVKYEGHDRYFTMSVTDYFLVSRYDDGVGRLATLVYGVVTIKKDQIARIEWLPIPINAIIH